MTRKPEQIEEDLGETRERLGRHMDEMGQRLTPGRMLDEAMASFDIQPQDFAAGLGAQVNRNPMATLLTLTGVAWMAFGGRAPRSDGAGLNGDGRSQTASLHPHSNGGAQDWDAVRQHDDIDRIRHEHPRRTDESETDYYSRLDQAYASHLSIQRDTDESEDSYRSRIRSAVEGARDRADQARSRLGSSARASREWAAQTGRDAQYRMDQARHNATAYHEENPLASGLLAAAAGAVIGTLLPVSRQEREALKPMSEELMDRGADLAEQAAGHAERARDEVKAQAGSR